MVLISKYILDGLMNSSFEIIKGYNGVVIDKNGIRLSIEKTVDNDMWFNASDNLELIISFASRNYQEWQCYLIFENLMKLIIGRYILSDDYRNEYSILPKDFIDISNKAITWHSDSGKDNILRLQLDENRIKIAISKDVSQKKYDDVVRVRIRTNGSDYENYYQEFEKFFNELTSLANRVDLSKIVDISIQETSKVYSKKLSFLNRLRKQ